MATDGVMLLELEVGGNRFQLFFFVFFLFFFFADVWSAGCVLAELLLGQPIFPGDSGVDQLVEIIKVLGTPTREQIREMNPNYTEFKFPQIKAHPWQKVRSNNSIFFCFVFFFDMWSSRSRVCFHAEVQVHPIPRTRFVYLNR